MLFLVSTPIGNLSDMSERAKRTLETVDMIACEDTRTTRQLCSLLGLKIPSVLVPYHEHNADKARPALIEKLSHGVNIALVSDAGTPLISDPGFKLVRDCHEHDIPVTTVPGANAVLSALQLSGLPSNAFYFGGFLPPKSSARQDALKKIASVPATLILYETAGRLLDSLSDIETVLGNRFMAVVREITKKFEETRRGTVSELQHHFSSEGLPKGELVLVIEKAPETSILSETELSDLIKKTLLTQSVRDTVDTLLPLSGKSKKELYKQVLTYAQKA